jgi:triacylglycerol lipase
MVVTWEDLLYPGRAIDVFCREPAPPLQPDRCDYDAGNAWWLAELSRLVYRCDEPQVPPATSVDALLERGQFQRLAVFSSDALGAQAILVRREQSQACAVLAFRGTQQRFQDLLHDADALLVPLASGARVHRGFLRALDAVWAAITPVLPRDCPLFLTGHSLGAALAILAATRCRPSAVYTFGAPRVGDDGLVQLLHDISVHRIVHGDDIVTMVPPSSLGFRHVGQEARIGLATLQSASLDPRKLWVGFGLPPKPLADHAPISYSRRLAAALV